MAKFIARDKARAEKFSKRIQTIENRNPDLRVTGRRGGKSVINTLSDFLAGFGSKLVSLTRSSKNKLLRQDPIENTAMRDAAIAKITAQTQREIDSALNQYAKGKVDADKLRDMFQATLRRQTLASAIIGVGGIGNLTDNVLTAVKKELAFQFRYLDGFIDDIDSRSLTLRDRARAKQYANSAWAISQTAARQFILDQNGSSADDLEEKRELGGSEHCDDCVEMAEEGWQPFGTLPPPGQASVCGSSCNCRIVVRQITNPSQNQQTTSENPVAVK
jgi:hypothetical protein